MLRHLQKFVLGVAVLLLLFGATAQLLPHQHNSQYDERVCPLCHPTIMGVHGAALQLPLPSNFSRTIEVVSYVSAEAAPLRHTSSRAPPAV